MAREFSVVGRIAALHEECVALLDEANAFLVDQGVGRFSDETPRPLRLALMGQYNAGKSTLVNALLGTRSAETGDAAETKEAHTYERDGFEIVDLPGSGARGLEQEAAHRGLLTAHVILYVVSSQTGLDYATFWTDLAWLEESRFPYLLVINDRLAHEDDADEDAARRRILGRFAVDAHTKLKNTQDRTFWLNARRAADGRTQNRPVLVEKSGIAALEVVLEDLLRRSEPLLRDRKRLAESLSSLRAVEAEAKEKLSDPRDQLLCRLLERVDETRSYLTAAASSVADDQFSPLGDLIAAQLVRAIESKDTDRNRTIEDVTKQLRSAFAAAADVFERDCTARLKRLAAEARDELAGGRMERDVNVNVGTVPGVTPADFDVLERLKNLGKRTGGNALVDLTRAGTESAFQSAGKTAAKRAGQVAGGIVWIAFAAVDIYQGYQAAAKQRDAVTTAAREVEARARQAAMLARQEFVSRATALVADELDPFERSLRERLDVEAGDARSARKVVARAESIKARIDSLMRELGELAS